MEEGVRENYKKSMNKCTGNTWGKGKKKNAYLSHSVMNEKNNEEGMTQGMYSIRNKLQGWRYDKRHFYYKIF